MSVSARLQTRDAQRIYNGNVFSSNVLFVMSLMVESANAELQGLRSEEKKGGNRAPVCVPPQLRA